MSGEVPRSDPRELSLAFAEFQACSVRLEDVFAGLQAQVRLLAAELSEKNRVIEALERQAARNERIAAMGELAQRIAHQLRNPLGSIQLYASILESDLRGHPSAALIERVAAAVQSCDLVVRNLLAFADDVDPVMAPLSLHAVLREAVSVAAQLVAPRGVDVELAEEAGQDRVEADGDLLRQAVLNLILNAAQAMGEGGTVRVATAERHLPGDEGRWVSLSVSDTGCGIAPADLERIFDPLFSTRRGASGLGLAIVQRVAEAHGGLVEVESQVGRGSVFRLSLPLAA